MVYSFLSSWNDLVLLYFIFVNLFYTLLIVVSFFGVKKYINAAKVMDDKIWFRFASYIKPVSILAPAYNEAATVEESLHSLLTLNYPQYEIILINDGSKDNTLQVVIERFHMKRTYRAVPKLLATKTVRGVYESELYPNLIVIDKENGGKADALNAGINASRYPLFTAIDTDSLLERDVLLKMIRPFVEEPETVAIGGVVRIINGCQVEGGQVKQIGLPSNPWVIFQIVEYFRAFLFGRVGWEQLKMLLVISGAFGMFKKDKVIAVGGYRHDTVGEDMDLVVRLHRHLREKKERYHIGFIPLPICWTEAPGDMRTLYRQRNRWHRGLMETLIRNWRMMFNPRYGRIGMLAFPFSLFVEGLGPVIELVGLISVGVSWYLGVLDPTFALAFLAAAILLGISLSTAALIVEEFTIKRYPNPKMVLVLFLFGILENLGYRQFNTVCRMMGLVDFFKGKKAWGSMSRSGFAKKP